MPAPKLRTPEAVPENPQERPPATLAELAERMKGLPDARRVELVVEYLESKRGPVQEETRAALELLAAQVPHVLKKEAA